MMDILQHIIDVYDLSDRRKWPLVYSLCVEKAGPLGWMGSQNFQTTPVSVVMQRYTRSGPYRAITLNDAISDLASLFASTATLRVPVSASDNPTNLVSIITQSQLVKTLANTLPTMGPIAFQPIQSLQLIRKFAWSLVNHSISNFAISLTLLCPSEMVLGVKETQLALEAFILIAQNGVTGVAVFDLDGCVVGNISVSDLRDLGSSMEMFFKVFMTARKFIDNKISGSDAPALAFVTPATSFGDMLTKITMMGVHRVYVVERADARLPIGVIALLDIIRLFAFVQSS
jgi:CBS domain-containing protein